MCNLWRASGPGSSPGVRLNFKLMPDLTLCSNETCTLRLSCYRFTATPNPRYQSFSFFNPVKEGSSYTCDMYINNKNLSSSPSPAFRRYSHREDCTLLFDLAPLFVVEQVYEDSRGTVYIVGDNLGLFTLDYKPELVEGSLRKLLSKLQQEKLDKIQQDCETDPLPVKYTGLEYL